MFDSLETLDFDNPDEFLKGMAILLHTGANSEDEMRNFFLLMYKEDTERTGIFMNKVLVRLKCLKMTRLAS